MCWEGFRAIEFSDQASNDQPYNMPSPQLSRIDFENAETPKHTVRSGPDTSMDLWNLSGTQDLIKSGKDIRTV